MVAVLSKMLIIVDLTKSAACGVVAQQLWEMLQQHKIKCRVVSVDKEPSFGYDNVLVVGDVETDENNSVLPTWIVHSSVPVVAAGIAMELMARTLQGEVETVAPVTDVQVIQELVNGRQVTSKRMITRTARVVDFPPEVEISAVYQNNDVAVFSYASAGVTWLGMQYVPDFAALQRFFHLKVCDCGGGE